jgi:hypothetical protein
VYLLFAVFAFVAVGMAESLAHPRALALCAVGRRVVPLPRALLPARQPRPRGDRPLLLLAPRIRPLPSEWPSSPSGRVAGLYGHRSSRRVWAPLYGRVLLYQCRLDTCRPLRLHGVWGFGPALVPNPGALAGVRAQQEGGEGDGVRGPSPRNRDCGEEVRQGRSILWGLPSGGAAGAGCPGFGAFRGRVCNCERERRGMESDLQVSRQKGKAAFGAKRRLRN